MVLPSDVALTGFLRVEMTSHDVDVPWIKQHQLLGQWISNSLRPPLEQRKSVGILEDLDPIENFPLKAFGTKD
jgi:hypothetical protein